MEMFLNIKNHVVTSSNSEGSMNSHQLNKLGLMSEDISIKCKVC